MKAKLFLGMLVAALLVGSLAERATAQTYPSPSPSPSTSPSPGMSMSPAPMGSMNPAPTMKP